MVKVRSLGFVAFFGLLWSVSQALDPDVIKNGLSSQEGSSASAALGKLKGLSSEKALSACFDPAIGETNLDLSNPDLHQLVSDYFAAYPELLEDQDEEERVRILASQFELLVNEVEDCVKGPAEQRSKLGFTSRLGYDRSEYLIDDFGLGKVDTDHKCKSALLALDSLPEEFNWADKGMVSPVKNQQFCKTCYIFTTTGVLESNYLIKNNITADQAKDLDFSEQDVINCIKKGDSCQQGGFYDQSFGFIQKRGIVSGKEEPYAGKTLECRKEYTIVANQSDWCMEMNDEPLSDEYLIQSVYTRGPVAVAVDADSFSGLREKVFSRPCGTSLNHAVVLVGWTKDHWIIKNSWGPSWGENGFGWILRDTPNKCGINTVVSAGWL